MFHYELEADYKYLVYKDNKTGTFEEHAYLHQYLHQDHYNPLFQLDLFLEYVQYLVDLVELVDNHIHIHKGMANI